MYHQLGFPVTNRYVWGIYGAWGVVLNRVVLSIGTVSRTLMREKLLNLNEWQSGMEFKRRFAFL